MTNKPGVVVALAILVLGGAAGAQTPQTSVEMRAAERAKALFGASQNLFEVSLNAQFGLTRANRSAFSELQRHLLALPDSKLQAKAKKAEKQCVTKDCKATLPPLSDLVTEWENFRKKLRKEDENYAMMGEATAGIRFYYRNAPQLNDALRKPLQALSLKQANLAGDACGQTKRCPASVKAAFEDLAKGLRDQTGTPEQVEASLKSIRDQLLIEQ